MPLNPMPPPPTPTQRVTTAISRHDVRYWLVAFALYSGTLAITRIEYWAVASVSYLGGSLLTILAIRGK